MAKSWILVGMMGSGKSSVGRTLAERSGRSFVDTDQLVHRKVARPIRQFFSIYGEKAFRDLETAVLQSLQPGEEVLATGGGIVLRPENWAELRRLGTTFYLKASKETLQARLAVSRNRRPLLLDEDWENRLGEILGSRAELYEQSDHIVDVESLSIDAVADRILDLAAEGA